MDFSNVLISKPYIQNIIQDKQKNNLSSGYLFYSLDMQTNVEVLKTLAYALLCNNNGCMCCPDCLKIKENTHPDLYPQGNMFSVIDAKDIIEQANKKPMLCDIKIIIINNIDISSEQAQNKLLKTLEEPPKNVIFLVSASNIDKVLPTIKSRLIKIEISPFTIQEITQLTSSYNTLDVYEIAIQNGDGYIGKTIQILNDQNYLNCYNLCKQIVTQLKSSAEILNYLSVKLEKQYFKNMLEILQSMYRDLIILKTNKQELVKNKGILKSLKDIECEFSLPALVNIISLINEANNKQNSNVNINLILESLLTQILEVKFLCK